MLPSDETVAFPSSFDVLISGGTVFDGLGNKPIRADIGVINGRIAAIGSLGHATSTQTFRAEGWYVSPGFIDIHTHSDLSILATPNMDSSLAQGVTSEIVGNCGMSLGLSQPTSEFAMEQRWLSREGVIVDWNDLNGFLRRIEDNGIAINVATLAGHGTLRKRVMGLANRPPSRVELTAMQQDLATAMEQGAVGLSSGLEYVPGMYADIAELVALATVAKSAGGFYATHLRDEGDTLEESVAEAIAVARGAGISLQLSHHKAERPRNWGKVRNTLAMVDVAQAEGLDILLDQYPYTAYQTGLATIALPAWVAAGTPTALAARILDETTRTKIKNDMTDVDWRAVEIAICLGHRDYQGRRVSELAQNTGKDPRDFVLDLLAESETFVAAAHFAMSEEDVERVMRDPRVMIGSDAVAMSPQGAMSEDKPHPRSYGTFARIFARYVREKGVLTWEEAIRRMTSLPAQRLGWRDRGQIAVGCWADVVVFDPLHIADRATFVAPHQLAAGIEHVLVAGTLAFSGGVPTGARPGNVLRKHLS
jgi:N-acyl-D-amino-acid deacylase